MHSKTKQKQKNFHNTFVINENNLNSKVVRLENTFVVEADLLMILYAYWFIIP